ncbi:hypothetical protein MATL_G00051120 [Megalops atlanticus]|uniref:C-type lectin domain-containing protein n=1 Tax=Megalops atlanticus TaxID=7932 RepID=A0A9D3QG00_MEGAT|nr:hypothetical protein MATL_G00051120 [Megalops atlanticus]
MSEGVLYSTVKFKKNLSPGPGSTQGEDVTYAEVKTTESSHCGPPGKNEKSSYAYRLAAVCLGLLCALLLTAIITLCICYISLSQKYSAMERNLKEMEKLSASYCTMTELNKLRQNCSFISQKRVCRPCLQGWEHFNPKYYYFSTEEKNWKDSRIECLQRGADLVIIESEEEQNFITNSTKKGEYWIGLNRQKTAKPWLWVDRTQLQTTFWRRGEPDGNYTDGKGEQHQNATCAVIVGGDNAWVDKVCNLKGKYVCETDALLT